MPKANLLEIAKAVDSGAGGLEMIRPDESEVAFIPISTDGEKVTIQMNDDVSILLFTDGLTEIKDEKNRLVGEKILLEIVTQNGLLPSREIISKLADKAQELKKTQDNQDDLTILGIDMKSD